MTAVTTSHDVQVHHSFGRLVPVLLIGAPLLMIAGRALLVPMDSDDFDQTLTDMAANQARSDLGWLLATAASGLLAITAWLLAARVAQAGRVRAAGIALVTTALGWAGCAAITVAGLSLSEAGKSPDRASQVALQEALNDGSTFFVFLLCLVGAIGYVVLAVGLARSGLASRGAAVLIGLGGAGTLLTMPGPLRPLLMGATALLLAGHLLTARED